MGRAAEIGEELAIVKKKDFGLIVPGLVPSPIGEVVDYVTSKMEILITLGILATGVLIVTMLIKPALHILSRFNHAK